MTRKEFLALLDYDPKTGIFLWKKTGRLAGGLKDGYCVIRINRKNYYGHRLAWLFQKGVWPISDIDHEDLNRSNNKIDNLREADPSLNGSNCGVRKHNKLGVKGVRRDHNRYRAQITVNGKCRQIGRFDTPEAAHRAYLVEARHAFGDFARAA